MSEESIPPMEITTSKDERTWAMLSHFSALCMFIFPFGNILAPLIIWLIKKEEMSFVEDQAKEVLNFQISMTIYLLISGILCFILIGIPFVIGLGIFNVIITIIAGIKANDGKSYRYPINLRLIK
jgi:uncharacterized Tic20 family protein